MPATDGRNDKAVSLFPFLVTARLLRRPDAILTAFDRFTATLLCFVLVFVVVLAMAAVRKSRGIR